MLAIAVILLQQLSHSCLNMIFYPAIHHTTSVHFGWKPRRSNDIYMQ